MNLPLNHPAFPDLVERWAAEEEAANGSIFGANDNQDLMQELSDPLFWLAANAEVAATRLW